MDAYVSLAFFLLATAGVVSLTLGLNALLGPRVAPTTAKL